MEDHHRPRSGATGIHDLVVVFRSNQPADFANLNWLTFTTSPSRDARARIEAETADAQSGVRFEATTDTGGGQNAGYIANGDSLTYKRVDFTTGIDQVQARLASGAPATVTGTMELHLDTPTGPIIGQVPVTPTGGWQSWKTTTTQVTAATGIHDLVVVFRSNQPADFANLNWLTFTTSPSRDARARIEAESADAQSGVRFEATTDTGGGQNAGYIANGDSLTYKRVDFTTGIDQVQARWPPGHPPPSPAPWNSTSTPPPDPSSDKCRSRPPAAGNHGRPPPHRSPQPPASTTSSWSSAATNPPTSPTSTGSPSPPTLV